jgi:hypothetical protein
MLTSVYLATPTYDGRIHNEILGAYLGGSNKGIIAKYQIQSGSWITRNFNSCYAAALNERKNGVTHFCLLHDDVVPSTSLWLDSMVTTMERVRASVLSVVVPLKWDRGDTSTAIDTDTGPKRMTLAEVYKQEPTFTDPRILLNTGCMLVDIRQDFADKLWFEFEDKIVKGEDGNFYAIGVPEDWHYSRQAKALGASLWATREIPVKHIGGGQWSNVVAQ